MPRPPRIELADAVYHVTSRGNARRQIFFTDDDRQRFLKQLRDNLAAYDVVLHAYVLMPNHYHLLVRTRRANLSRFMQRLGTSYALYFRVRIRRGPSNRPYHPETRGPTDRRPSTRLGTRGSDLDVTAGFCRWQPATLPA